MSVKVLRHFEANPMIPGSYLSTLKNYLSHPKDWCLSRQLWWGHQIPAYRVHITTPSFIPKHPSTVISTVSSSLAAHCEIGKELWVVAPSESIARHYVVNALGYPSTVFQLEQDEDVLDTWFSSGLLPSLAAPSPNTPPISVMETGGDILFFWICRMAWLAVAQGNPVPFDDVLLHSMVLDPNGKKMSKSRGNVIDPLAIIHGESLKELEESVVNRKELSAKEKEISVASFRKQFPAGIRAYGNDVLRLTLLTEAGKTSGITMSLSKLEYGRYVTNKLWNLFRFYCNYANDDPMTIHPMTSSDDFSPVEKYIISKCELVAREEERLLGELNVSKACELVIHHLLNDICDL